jgi:hypothetical protein
MRKILLLALLVTLASPAAAEETVISPKEAIRTMVAAGYSGIGGVTRDDPYYFAAAIDSTGKPVRIAVDVHSGKISKVMRRARGAGSVTPMPDIVPDEPSSHDGPRIQTNPIVGQNYAPPPPRHYRAGVRSYPWNSYNRPAAGWCRYQAYAPGC